MIYSSTITRAIGVCVLSAAFFMHTFAATRYVPTSAYPNILAAYNASAAGDVIVITSNQSTTGFTINKANLTIRSGSTGPTMSISLTSGFQIAADGVTFSNVIIIGPNSFYGCCIQINAGVSGFSMHGCTVTKHATGSTQHGIRDLGTTSSGYYGTNFNGTTVGFYGENVRGLNFHYENRSNSFNNPTKNMYIKRAGSYAGDMGGWIEAVNFYAGYQTNAVCFHAYNAYSGNIPWYWIEGCSFQAWGTGAKCTKSETSESMNAINLQACTLTHCP